MHVTIPRGIQRDFGGQILDLDMMYSMGWQWDGRDAARGIGRLRDLLPGVVAGAEIEAFLG
jgi:hypothetical protein